jgi:hypothetical protein
MRALVVYESLFGNTCEVARAIGDGIREARPGARVDVLPVDEAPGSPAGIDLVVVGGPTHFLGMTSRLSREMERQYELRIRRPVAGRDRGRRSTGTAGLRGWLTRMPRGHAAAAAVFDTRMAAPVAGGAAPGIARRLRRRGYRLVAAPRTFTVAGVGGPLVTGEADRARAWGRELARTPAPGGRRPRPDRPRTGSAEGGEQ